MSCNSPFCVFARGFPKAGWIGLVNALGTRTVAIDPIIASVGGMPRMQPGHKLADPAWYVKEVFFAHARKRGTH
jgi:hypothetical protein